MTYKINGNITPRIGDFVSPDNWNLGGKLITGGTFSTFRIPTNLPVITDIAAEVEVSGRKFHTTGMGNYKVRVKITFPGDNEPDVVTRGWMFRDSLVAVD
jgi:hypothetical protein